MTTTTTTTTTTTVIRPHRTYYVRRSGPLLPTDCRSICRSICRSVGLSH